MKLNAFARGGAPFVLLSLGVCACGPGSASDTGEAGPGDHAAESTCDDGVRQPDELCLSRVSLELDPARLRAADFDADGHTDLAALAPIDGGYELRVWLGDGAGDFASAPVSVELGASGNLVLIGEFDGEGGADVAIIDAQANTIVSFGAVLGELSSSSSVDLDAGPWNMILKFDADADGVDDFVAERLDGGDTLSLLSTQPGGGVVNEGLSAPIDGACSFTASAALPVFGSFAAGLVIAAGECADESPGHPLTLLWAKPGGELAASLGPATGLRPTDIGAGDFDGDGTPELLVWNAGTQTLDHFRALLTGNFEQVASMSLADLCPDCPNEPPLGSPRMQSANFGGGPSADLLLVTGGELHTGRGLLSSSPLWTHHDPFPNHLVVADFNEDGLDDLVVETNAEAAVFMLRAKP